MSNSVVKNLLWNNGGRIHRLSYPNDKKISSSSSLCCWDPLLVAIFVAYSLSVASVSVPITLAPLIAADFHTSSWSASTTSFASQMTSSAILGISLGKFINGGFGDIFGPRFILVVYSLLGGISLLLFSISYQPRNVWIAGAMVEFFQSVQWPCLTIMLTSHYGTTTTTTTTTTAQPSSQNTTTTTTTNSSSLNKYETAINIVALASRFGAILSIPLCSIFVRRNIHWRTLCRGGAGISFLSTLVYALGTTDTPRTRTSRKQQPTFFPKQIISSLQSILKSGTFWTVSLAHTGASMVRSSERLLGTYFESTSDGTVSTLESSGYSIVMALGLVTGLVIWGSQFSSPTKTTTTEEEEEEKKEQDDLSRPPRHCPEPPQVVLLRKLYTLAVAMCMVLSLLSMPPIRNCLFSNLAWILKLLSCFLLAASLAVPYYHLPALVASKRGGNAVGLYVSYTDGVACAISSFLIQTLGRIVQHGNPQRYGWAYCWGDIAIIIAVTGGMMVHFLRNFLVSKTSLDMANQRRPYHVPSVRAKRMAQFHPTRLLKNHTTTSSYNPRQPRPPVPVMNTHDLMLFDSDSSEEDEDDTILNPLDESIGMQVNTNNTSFVEMIPTSVKQEPTNDLVWKRRVLQALDEEENTKCVDCESLFPRWASILVPLHSKRHMGCFCCQDCATFHRRLGVHIVFVRSVDHDMWNENEVNAVEFGGNAKVNLIYEALLVDRQSIKEKLGRNFKLREEFIFNKYQKRLWMSQQEESNLLLDLSLSPVHKSVFANDENLSSLYSDIHLDS